MKILVFAALYHPFEGGYADSIHEVTKRLFIRGHSVLVLTCNTHKQSAYDIKDGVRIWRVNCWNPLWLNETFPIPRPLSLLKIIKKLNQEHFDIISTQTRFFPTSWCGFLFAKLKKIPIVHTERGSQHTYSNNLFVGFVGWVIDHTFGWLICRFSNGVIGVSGATCAFSRHLGARQPIKIYNGINTELWRLSSHTNLRTSDVLNITFVGRLIYAKGVQDLLRALAHLKAMGHKLKANIVGDGSYRTALEKLTDRLNLRNQILFWGKINREIIRRVFEETNIFVNPSYSEGLPRCVLEAAAAGLPIIATDVGGTKEIIVGEHCGLLVAPGNVDLLAKKIDFLSQEIKLRQALAINVQKYTAVNFNLEKMVNTYEKVYSDFNNLL